MSDVIITSGIHFAFSICTLNCIVCIMFIENYIINIVKCVFFFAIGNNITLDRNLPNIFVSHEIFYLRFSNCGFKKG